jgi:hypothetical protein
VVIDLSGHYPRTVQNQAFRLALCRVLGIPRSTSDYRRVRRDETAVKRTLNALAGKKVTYGILRLTHEKAEASREMKRSGQPEIGKRRITRLMREENILKAKPRKRIRTTDSRHEYPRYPNLVKDRTATKPNEIWVADITYVRLWTEFVYLAVIMDQFTSKDRRQSQGATLTLWAEQNHRRSLDTVGAQASLRCVWDA